MQFIASRIIVSNIKYRLYYIGRRGCLNLCGFEFTRNSTRYFVRQNRLRLQRLSRALPVTAEATVKPVDR